jgi:hypothetical protein
MIVIDSIKTNKEKIANGLLRIYFKNIEFTSLNNLIQTADDSSNLHRYNNKTFHKYEEELPENIREYIQIIKYGSIYETLQNMNPNCNILSINKMNEIYISCIGSQGSDRVFETPHIDGIYFFLPFCVVYRCVFAIQGNDSIVTSFPTRDIKCTLHDDNYCAFDYNREIHYIYQNEEACDKQRILIKLHYISCPRFLPLFIVNFYRLLHSNYNSFMRNIFLKSQHKNSWLAFIVNNGTVFFISFYTNLHFVKVFALYYFIYFLNYLLFENPRLCKMFIHSAAKNL